VLRRKFALALALAVAASLMLAGGALARDRNHDRIPDKWEKRHHLSLHHKQNGRDQDHDGLKNRGEFRAHLNPRDADTDDDGIDDGDEHPGEVKSFEDGVLTISLFNGGEVSGAVTDDTEVECDDDAADDHEGDHHHGDHHGDDGDDDHGGDDDAMAADHGDDEHEDGEDCGTDALVAGAKVLEAELKIRNGEAVWEEVELLATP
jgi:hypothetical protein